MKTQLVLCTSALAVALTGCAGMSDTQRNVGVGAGAGALGGAAIGAATGNSRSAAAGAAIGA
ncbi:MAG TPA: hypothetical protein VE084_04785, partial [Burkholderiaceae bacterium]|nr:hypothetical protein [Burkholderiaceae bacterium]